MLCRSLAANCPVLAFKSALGGPTHQSRAILIRPPKLKERRRNRNKPWTYNRTLRISLKMRIPAQIGPGETEANIVVSILGMIVVPVRGLQIVWIVVVPGATTQDFMGLSPACRQAGLKIISH